MNKFRSFKEFFLKSLPVIFLYFIVINSFENLNVFPSLFIFSFNLQLIIIYFYILKYPDYLGLGHVFIAGLINDVIVGSPLGSSSLSYLVSCFFSIYIRNVTLHETKMRAQWITFIPVIFFSNLTYFVIINNFSNLSFYYIELLRNSFFTFLFFPFFYYFFSQYQKILKKYL